VHPVAGALMLGAALTCLCCAAEPPDDRPSILLVVVDTLRTDAVSAYGAVDGTTPSFDELAAGGLLYQRAYAPSPWTLPSHASLLSGLGIDQHGVGIHGNTTLPDEVVTLAERLRAAGYATIGFSENLLISEPFQMSQGFEQFRSSLVTRIRRLGETRGAPLYTLDVVEEVATWATGRDRAQPFFVFVNLFDPHSPYEIREANPFLPVGVSEEQARLTSALKNSPHRICERLPADPHIRILRGLYLGDVAAADAKLGAIQELLSRAVPTGRLITVVTSDHGEHFGEHRLLDHEFSVRDAVLSVPLLVHGLPGAAPASIGQSVGLTDIVASILQWTGSEVPPELHGRPLPSAPSAQSALERDLIAVYSDEKMQLPASFRDIGGDELREEKRTGCGDQDRVFGRMVALTRYPLKLTWFENYPAELHDLSWDPEERFDLSSGQPEVAQLLQGQIERFIDESGLMGPAPQGTPEADPEAVEALRSLGYLE